MEANILEVQDAASFFQTYTNPSTTPAASAPPQENLPTNQEPPQKDAPVETTEGDVNKFLEGANKGEEDKEKNKEPKLDNLDAVSSKLFEDKIIYKFEDDSLPKTYEELKEAINQSTLHNSTEQVNKLFEQRIQSLSPTLQTVLEYGMQGVTSAIELQQIIGKVANYEAVASLDPKNEQHQERIIEIQLLNSGWSEDAVKDEIALYKDSNKLAQKAEQFFPSLQQRAQQDIQQSFLEKQRAIEEQNALIDNNATNVQYFLENDSEYLPFKIDSKQHKAAAFNLAAQPVAYDEQGEAIFGWQNYLKSLQYGTEKDYKTFMKIVNFMANPDYYEKKLGKTASTNAKTDTYKTIKTNQSSPITQGFDEGEKEPRIQKSASPWTIK